jgi:hypothetical protein
MSYELALDPQSPNTAKIQRLEWVYQYNSDSPIDLLMSIINLLGSTLILSVDQSTRTTSTLSSSSSSKSPSSISKTQIMA